jgi:murein DD-endopeptidase MepM/ murein hydrolase activator NlpD
MISMRASKKFIANAFFFPTLFISLLLFQCKDKEQPITEVVEIDSVEVYVPELYYDVVVDSLEIYEGRIKRNQFLADMLEPFNVSNQTIHNLAIQSKKVFDVRKLVRGKNYAILHQTDSLKTATHFIYKPDAISYVVYEFGDSISIYKKEKPIKLVEKTLVSTIESSLYETMMDAGATPELVDKMVDIFAWKVDFFGIQEGDNFKLIYEEKYVDSTAVGINSIKGAYFQHLGDDHYAVSFDQGKGVDYFEPSGKSLRRNLLKAPLSFTRISSRYSGRRFHPVQKRYKAHRGTDYAAPSGTPIRTVGDGVVLEARYHKYNGNFVKIKHNDNISTQYLHMSKIKTGIRKGVRVKQGQTIGFVGQTGLARGSHLCYRFWKNGVQVDALKVDLPPAEPIEEVFKQDFDSLQNIIVRQLNEMVMVQDTTQLMTARIN